MKIESHCRPACQADRQEMIARLKNLREEIEQDGVKIVSLETTFALALSDVCDALELTSEERTRVLGPAATACIDTLLDTRVWLVETESQATLLPARLPLPMPA
ncbi:MAG: hypothetical protein KKA73_13670 [Chloroflexi bacterium]|nr:hypothetical protein [Chloroflexota bacterium]